MTNLHGPTYSGAGVDEAVAEARFAERQRVVKALRPWLRHKDECRRGLSFVEDGPHRLLPVQRECDCGLSAKLEDLRAEAEGKKHD